MTEDRAIYERTKNILNLISNKNVFTYLINSLFSRVLKYFVPVSESPSSKAKYTVREVSLLNKIYDRGLRSKRKHPDLLKEAEQETRLRPERIMVFNMYIGNWCKQ